MKSQTISAPKALSIPRLLVSQLDLCLLATVLFLAWSLVFIWQTSFTAIDGQRYFSLFDDAMISMRYAWNFSHGLGLVWNAGEHVEGYSNLLMTLIMSAATFLLDKKLAVLSIQLLGIPTILGVAFLTRQLARHLYPADKLLADLAFTGVLAYLPFSYWSLLGMESGLLTLLVLAAFLCGLRWLENRRPWEFVLVALFLGLAFLTRNESLLLTGLVCGYLAYRIWRSGEKKIAVHQFFYALLLYALFISGQLAFRLWQYGQFLPNTYMLKVTGIPLSLKLAWGWAYVWPFLAQSWPLLGLALAALMRARFRNAILILFIAILLTYQVIVGGDSFGLWRILLPGMPFVFVLAVSGALHVHRKAGVLFLLLGLAIANTPLIAQVYNADGKIFQTLYNKHNVNVALGVNAVTAPDATIGVIWAGAIPYYADRRAIDFLGKSDSYIASLPADLRMSLIGHNKYDLQYSIHRLQPSYIQDFRWGHENIRPWVVKHYVRANYATADGNITLILKRDDPSVQWDKVTIIPWAENSGQFSVSSSQ